MESLTDKASLNPYTKKVDNNENDKRKTHTQC